MAQRRAKKTAVLLVNLGSPDAPTATHIRRYLREFLGDPRVVNLPRFLWWIILNFIVLPLRPFKAVKSYRKIWTDNGSPLIFLTRKLSEKLNGELESRGIVVKHAMRYGKPSLSDRLNAFHDDGVDRMVVVPLYPQYSSTTTASVFDEVDRVLRRWRHIPSVSFISDYHDHDAYIMALADSVKTFWQEQGRNELLLMSFHGLPARLTKLGDPYYHQCQTTAKRIAEQLGLTQSQWQLVFQSRFGKAEWLKPYCVDVLQKLPGQGVQRVDIVCPGFAVDCLETLEEIAITNRNVFMQAGGQSYRYIPALNESDQHVHLIRQLLAECKT